MTVTVSLFLNADIVAKATTRDSADYGIITLPNGLALYARRAELLALASLAESLAQQLPEDSNDDD